LRNPTLFFLLMRWDYLPPEESRHVQAIGRSRGGSTAKLMALVDRKGRLVRFSIHPGNAAESPTVPDLLDGLNPDEFIGDKAYDTNILRRALHELGVLATIPTRSYRREPFPLDEDSYRTRHLVENLFADLKQFRASPPATASWPSATSHSWPWPGGTSRRGTLRRISEPPV